MNRSNFKLSCLYFVHGNASFSKKPRGTFKSTKPFKSARSFVLTSLLMHHQNNFSERNANQIFLRANQTTQDSLYETYTVFELLVFFRICGFRAKKKGKWKNSDFNQLMTLIISPTFHGWKMNEKSFNCSCDDPWQVKQNEIYTARRHRDIQEQPSFLFL